MRSHCILVPLTLALFHFTLRADDAREGSPLTFLPGRLLVHPFMSNYHEPRVGLRKEIGTSRLKIDIGSTFDLVEYTVSARKSKKLRAGIDFFTYALSTSAEGRRLQIDAVDGLFGGHISYQADDDDAVFSLRLRMIHSSAHFMDGHFDNTTGTWKNGIAPIPFTRDFLELIGAYEFRWTEMAIMLYTGFSYSTLVRPEDIKRTTTTHGVEIHTASSQRTVFGQPFSFFLTDNLFFLGIPSYIATNNLEFGLKFGEWSGSGVRLYASYYTGLSVFSQYYRFRESSWGVGFAFDVW